MVARSPEKLVKVSNRRVRDRHLHLLNGEFQFHHSGPRGDARGQCDRWKHRTFNNEIDFAGPEGLDPMEVDNIKPSMVPSVFHVSRGRHCSTVNELRCRWQRVAIFFDQLAWIARERLRRKLCHASEFP